MDRIDGYARYAIYWAPAPGSDLARAGARWLGWDPASGTETEAEGGELAAAPRRYGLHATLKPPFRLAEDASAAELDDAAARLAARLSPATGPALAVDAGLGFAALRPTGPCPEIDALAASCVRDLDRFRAPPSDAELARRRAQGLDAEGEALLAAWGYPHVLHRFRFHVTLTGRLDAPTGAALLPRLAERFGPYLAEAFRIGHICLFGDPGQGAGFRLLRRYALTG